MDLFYYKIKKASETLILKNQIKNQESRIKQEIRKLEELKDEYAKLRTSDLPVLLFSVNQAMTTSKVNNVPLYEHVYFLADLDEITYTLEHDKDALLPNTIDLRSQFKDYGVPEMHPSKVIWNYKEEIERAATTVKEEVNAYIKEHRDTTWEDVANHLGNKSLEKVKK